MALMAAATSSCANKMISGCTPATCATAGARCRQFTLSSRQLLQLRCNSANKESAPGRGNNRVPVVEAPAPISNLGKSLQDSVDRVTKQLLTSADIERHQAEASSEKQSFLGARPSSTTPWPRPELERRPETGDRSFGSLFAVDGAAPETINGRMAMLGFVWAFVAEKTTGLSVMEQLFNPATFGLLWFALAVQLFTLASIIPFANGESTDSRRWGPFTATAERWNGRLAMIGFAVLLVDEMIRQGPLFR